MHLDACDIISVEITVFKTGSTKFGFWFVTWISYSDFTLWTLWTL